MIALVHTTPQAMNMQKAEKVMASNVRDPISKEMVKRKKAKPLRIIERDMEIVRLMHIVQNADIVSQKTGVSKRRVYQIISEYRDSLKDDLGKMDALSLASQAKERYEMLFNETIKLAIEAQKIMDPKDRINAKSNVYEKAGKAQAQMDNLLKLLGVYKEHSVHEHIDLTRTEEWLRMEEAMRIFLRYFIGVDPAIFTEFVEKIHNDSRYFDFIKRKAQERERRIGVFGPEIDFDVDDFLPAGRGILQNIKEELEMAEDQGVTRDETTQPIDAEFTQVDKDGIPMEPEDE